MKKNIALIAVLIIAAAALSYFFKIETTGRYYGGESPLWESGPSAVLSIECGAAADNRGELPPELRDERYVPADGYILAPTKLALAEGESAYDLLMKAARYYEISVDAQGSGENSLGTVYIRGINQLYEFSAGELSGWTYSVNGELPGVGCDELELSDGDEVRFIYTLDIASPEVDEQ
ncbi:MAG: DUF4430 domain-containing protein [Oscillospiraceae bacterium]|nr:DUF4430 domain-containing protein [Oscillospiraceae bacterium]